MSRRMSTLPCTFIFLITFTFSEAIIPKKLPSAVVVGTVYCDTCFHQDFSESSHFISGASVAVECGDKEARPSFRQVAKTNEHGEFKVHLPFSVSKHAKKIKGCSVKLISSSEPYCAVASTTTSSSIHLKSRNDGTHIFSAGFFTFKPLKQPELCDQKPTIHKTKTPHKTLSISDPNDPKFLPPIQDPPTSDLPPLGQNYLPPLPELPNLPPLPRLPPLPSLPELPSNPPGPGDEKVAEPEFFNPIPLPPNPFLPPPSIFPPITNPFQPPPSILPPISPSPPSSIFPPIFPPIFPSPPSSIFPPIFPPIFPSPPSPPPTIFPPLFPSPPQNPPFHLPPLIPGLTPSPPLPPPPFLPIPIPPFPFQPTPGFPGVPPPNRSSSSSEKSSP